MTPLHLMILLHYYGCADEYARHNPAHASSRAVNQFKIDLVAWSLIEETPLCDATSARFKLTDKGIAHVEKLKALPLPVAKMVWE